MGLQQRCLELIETLSENECESADKHYDSYADNFY